MQKLPEASERKKGRCMRKEKGTSRQKEESRTLRGCALFLVNIGIFVQIHYWKRKIFFQSLMILIFADYLVTIF